MKKSFHLKNIAIILVCVTVFCSLASVLSCKSKLSEEEILAIFTEKYNVSVDINEYVFGAGLETVEYELNGEESYYADVADSAAYRTKDAFLAAIHEVYTSDYVEDTIIPKLFDGYGEDVDILPRYGENNGLLTRNVCDEGMTFNGSFSTETAAVVKLTSSTAKIKAQFVFKDGSTLECEIIMLIEDGQWKFNQPTY